MRKVLSCLLFFILLLLSCAPLRAGRIVAKDFVPSHSETHLQPIPVYINNVIHFIYVPQYQTIPDAWSITLVGVDDSGVERQQRVKVSSNLYNAVKVGDWYSISEPR